MLAENDYAPKTLAQVITHPKLQSLPAAHIVEAAIVLTGAGYAHPAQQPSRHAKARCGAMNRYLCEQARSNNTTFLASPLCAVGVPIGQFEQLFLLATHAWSENTKRPGIVRVGPACRTRATHY